MLLGYSIIVRLSSLAIAAITLATGGVLFRFLFESGQLAGFAQLATESEYDLRLLDQHGAEFLDR